MSSERVLVILPAKDEQGRVGTVLDAVRRVLPDADRVVIDDGSCDGPADEAAKSGARVLSHAVNMGYGASLETGYRYAVRQGFGIVAQMDADGQHIAEELPRLLEPVERGEVDIAIGARDSTLLRGSPVRRAGQLFFSVLLLTCMRRWFADPTSGFQVLGPRAVRFFASGVFPCDYPDADVLLMAHLAGLRIREYPVRMRPRAGGRSMHAGLRPVYYGAKMLLSVFIVLLNVGTWRAWDQRFREGC